MLRHSRKTEVAVSFVYIFPKLGMGVGLARLFCFGSYLSENSAHNLLHGLRHHLRT